MSLPNADEAMDALFDNASLAAGFSPLAPASPPRRRILPFSGPSQEAGAGASVGGSKRRKTRGDEDESSPSPSGPALEEDAAYAWQEVISRLDRLSRQAQQVAQVLDTSQPDATLIYRQYQDSQFELIREIERLMAENEQSGARNRPVPTNLLTRLNRLEELVEQMEATVTEVKRVREEFQVSLPMTDAQDLANYYGVYMYNTLLNKAKASLQELQNLPGGVDSADTLATGFLFPRIDQVTEVEVRKQQALKAMLVRLTVSDPNNAQKWADEAKVVTARLPDGGNIGSIAQASALAKAAVLREPQWKKLIETSWNRLSQQSPPPLRPFDFEASAARAEEMKSSASSVASGSGGSEESNDESPVEAEMKDVGFVPPSALEALSQVAASVALPTYALGGIANERMFENDIVPGQDQKQAFDARVKRPARVRFAERSQREIGWRQTSAGIKQALLQEAAQDWNASKTGGSVLFQALSGVAQYLGVQVLQYAPQVDPVLLQFSATWDDAQMTNQMRAACRQDPSKLESIQRVIPLDRWKQNILDVAKGQRPPDQDVRGWLMLDVTGTKLLGFIHCRSSVVNRTVISYSLRTTQTGFLQGVPNVTDDLLSNTLDVTFLCAQRLADTAIEEKSTVNYALRGKAPQNLGTFLMLWALADQLKAQFKGLSVEVVFNSGREEGFSGSNISKNNKADTTVAAFYHRYFKFQRTSPLAQFNATDEVALAYFHPGFEAYRITRQDQGTEFEVMYRPYPTERDLSDMTARLIQSLKTYFSVQ